MWINSILREVDKCHIPNVLLPRVPCCHWVTGVMHTQSQIHILAYRHIQTLSQRNTYKRTKDAHRDTNLDMWDCHLSAWRTSVPEGAGVRRALEGKRCGGWTRGRNHKFGMSHGQTEKIYDWSGSTSAAWCCGFRMPGMGVRSDSGFRLYTLSGNCSRCDRLKMAVLLGFGVGNVVPRCLAFYIFLLV